MSSESDPGREDVFDTYLAKRLSRSEEGRGGEMLGNAGEGISGSKVRTSRKTLSEREDVMYQVSWTQPTPASRNQEM